MGHPDEEPVLKTHNSVFNAWRVVPYLPVNPVDSYPIFLISNGPQNK